MSDGSGVEVVGLADAQRDMTRWADELGPAVAAQAQPFADRLVAQVRGEVPVLTGTLAASVEVADVDDGLGVGIGDGVPYAGWIEFGGSRGRDLVPEGRYLYPAAVAAEDDYARIAETIAEQTAERFSWSTPPQ